MFAEYIGGLRELAEADFEDTFTAYSPGGTTTDGDGFPIPSYVKEGTTPGKVSGPSAQTADTNTTTTTVGGVEREVVKGGLHIPISAFFDGTGEFLLVAGEHGTGWELELTELGAGTDPSLLGSRWLVFDAPAKSHATARRLDVVRLA